MRNKVESQPLSGFLVTHSENESDPVEWAFQEDRFLPKGKTIWDKLPEQGLHILGDGDDLTINSVYRKNLPIWQGVIKLEHFPPIIEDVFGLKISSLQYREDRGAWVSWFVKRNDAKLVLAKNLHP